MPAPWYEEDTLFAVPTRLDRIGRVVVPVTIDGKGPFRFVVDTGASHSTMSPALATRLGLVPTADANIRVNGITGTEDVPSVTIARLQAGDFLLENTSVPVVWASVFAGADGILGAAGLTNERLRVDFDRNRVVLSEARHARTPFGYTRVSARRVAGGLLAIKAKVGRTSVIAIIDTGSERTLGNLALRDAMTQRRRPGELTRVTNVFGATTEVASGEMRVLPMIVIDQLRIADVTVVYGGFHIFKVWGLESEPALVIGMDVLGTVGAMEIDFKHPSLYLSGKGLLAPQVAGLRSFTGTRLIR